MKLAIGCLALSLSVPLTALADAPMALEDGGEPDDAAWACAPAGHEAARLVRTESFSSVRVRDLDAVILVDSPVPYVVIEGDANAILDVQPVVSRGVLSIERHDCTSSVYGMRVVIGAPAFDDVDVEDVGRVRSRGSIELGPSADIDIKGASASDLEVRGGDVSLFSTAGFHRLTIRATTLIAHHSRSGVLRIAGVVDVASLGQDGAGYVIADQLEAADVVTERSGAGVIRLAGR